MGISTNIKNYFKKIDESKKLKNKVFNLDLDKTSIPDFKNFLNPDITIIVYATKDSYNLYKCLQYLSIHLNSEIAYQIKIICENELVLDKNVHDYEFLEIKKSKNVFETITNEIHQTQAEFIYLLNSNFLVQENFLDELFYVFDNFDNVGAVCSQIFDDKNAVNAGYFKHKDLKIEVSNNKKKFNPELNYIQKIDFCNESLFFKVADFKNNFILTEDFDTTKFCENLKSNIYYTPFSKVFSTKKLKIEIHLKNNTAIINNRINDLYHKKTVVVFCGMIPMHDRDSGSNRLKEIITAFVELGFYVTIICKNVYYDNTYIEYYSRKGVNVYYEHDSDVNVEKYLRNRDAKYSWFYSPNVFNDFYKISQKQLPHSKLIYDMVDIHHLRFERAIEIEPKRFSLRKKYFKYKNLEKKCAQIADIVVAISKFEAIYLNNFCKVKKIVEISNIHYLKIDKKNTKLFENRAGILFIGSIHTPNIDAIYYLFNEIMPLVWNELPNVKLNIIGNIIDKVKDINHPNINFLGFMSNIDSIFASNKMMVAPLRYGAGVKGKIGQAFEYYLPVVTSSVGAEGMHLINNQNAIIDDTAIGFANAIISVYTNKELWQTLQNNSEKSLMPFSRESLKEKIKTL